MLFFAFKEISRRFKRKPPRRGQPLYKGQLARPQCVLSSEVLLYIKTACLAASHIQLGSPNFSDPASRPSDWPLSAIYIVKGVCIPKIGGTQLGKWGSLASSAA